MGPTVWVSPNVLVNHQLASDIQYVTGFAWPAFRNIIFFVRFSSPFVEHVPKVVSRESSSVNLIEIFILFSNLIEIFCCK